MTSVPIPRGIYQPREWNIGSRTLIVSATTKRALAVLNAPSPLLLPPGSIVQFDGQPAELVVTGVRVIAGRLGGIVCAEVEPLSPGAHDRRPAPKPRSQRPRQLRPVPGPPLTKSPAP
jgi:hypothetical protein